MKITTGYKSILFLVSAITAVILVILPFLAVKKDTLYLYTQFEEPSSAEEGFIRELKILGFDVIVNSSTLPTPNSYGFWFKNPDYVEKIEKSEAKINFLYTEAYYPIQAKGKAILPIILTPYQNLYEHYARSNIKAAKMELGVNLADFYGYTVKKPYNVVYYGDNNKISSVANKLKKDNNVKFLGAFWAKGNNVLDISLGSAKARHKILEKTKIVIIDNPPQSPESKRIPLEVMESSASGALVVTSLNEATSATYQENIIMYRTFEELEKILQELKTDEDKRKHLASKAQEITIKKLSSVNTAQRFKEIFDWLKKYN